MSALDLREAKYRRLWLMATGLFALMVGAYALAAPYEQVHPVIGFVRAFAEGGMVGALADWFAVVALFRYPLGIPIPHTAVIPNRKDEIAESLAAFVQTNFLSADRILAKLAQIDLPRRIADWLADERNASRLAEKVVAALPGMLDAFDSAGMDRFLREDVLGRLRNVPLAPAVGTVLGVMTEAGKHQELFEHALRIARAAVRENKDFIESKLAGYLPAVTLPETKNLPVVGQMRDLFQYQLEQARRSLVAALAEPIIREFERTLDGVIDDPNHRFRSQFDAKISQFVRDLAESPQLEKKAKDVAKGILTNSALLATLDTLWQDVKAEIIADSKMPDSAVRARLATTVQEVGAGLQRDQAFRATLDQWVTEGISNVLANHGHEIGLMVRDTVKSWNTKELAAKLNPKWAPIFNSSESTARWSAAWQAR